MIRQAHHKKRGRSSDNLVYPWIFSGYPRPDVVFYPWICRLRRDPQEGGHGSQTDILFLAALLVYCCTIGLFRDAS